MAPRPVGWAPGRLTRQRASGLRVKPLPRRSART